MAFHLERRGTRKGFGNPGVLEEQSRDAWGFRWLDELGQDLTYAARSLRKAPAYTIAAVLTLAVAIGANTSVFSVVNGVLLRPLPFPHQDRLLFLYEQSRSGSARPASYPTFLDWQDHTDAFDGLAYIRGRGTRIAGPDGPTPAIIALASPGFFATLAEKPYLGRLYTVAEAAAGAHVAVIAYRLWRQRFGGDPRALGTTLSLSDGDFTLVGVLPPDVTYPAWAQIIVPLPALAAGELALTQRGLHVDSRVIGRVKPGITPDQAARSLQGIEAQLALQYPDLNAGWTSIGQFPIRNELLGNAGTQALILMGAVALVLLIACANVTSLGLARAGARARELALRQALGAGHGRLIRQLLAEGVLLTAAGCAGGALFSVGGIRFVQSSGLFPRAATLQLSGWVLAFVAVMVSATTLAVGLAPALRATQPELVESLKEGGRAAGTGRRRQRLRAVLVTTEVALAVVLAAGTGLLLRTLRGLREVSPGFDPGNLVTFGVAPPPSKQPYTPERISATYIAIQQALEHVPGVSGVAVTNFAPLSGAVLPSPVEIPGRAPDPARDQTVVFLTVSPDYFATMRIPVRRGRALTDADLTAGNDVVVSEAFAKQFWPGQDAIGQAVVLHKSVQGRADFGAPMHSRVVGVVGDVHHGALDLPAEPEVYVPFTRNVWGHVTMMIRTAVPPETLIPSLKEAVRRVNPAIALVGGGGFPTVAVFDLDAGLAPRVFDAWALGGFGVTALLLAALGVYGLLAYSVSQRWREIGIRLALGASRPRVFRLVVGDGLRLAAIGVCFGIAGAAGLTRLLGSLLYAVRPGDPVTLTGVSALLLAVAFAASSIPASRAALADPMTVLRRE